MISHEVHDPVLALLPGKPGVVSLVGSGGKTSLMFALASLLQRQGQKVLTTTTTKIYPPPHFHSPFVYCTSDPVHWLSSHQDLVVLHGHTTLAAGVLPQAKLQGFSPRTIDAIHSLGLFDWILVEADGAGHRPLKAPAEHEPVVPESSSMVITVAGMWGVGKPLCTQWVLRPERFASLAGMDMNQAVSAEHLARVLVHPQGPLKASPPASINVLFLNLAPGSAHSKEISKKRVQKVLEKARSGYTHRLCGRVDNKPALRVMHRV